MAFSEKYVKRLASLEKAYGKLENCQTLKLNNDVLVEVVTKRFEYTFESLWKTIKTYLLEMKGIDCSSPMDCFKSAFQERLIPPDYENIFIDIIRTRNEIVHIYDEDAAKTVYGKIVSDYIDAIGLVVENLKK